MYNVFLLVLTIIFSIIVAKLILKKYNAIFVFVASGVVILMAASLLTGHSILGKDTMGNVFLDTFGFIAKTFKSNVSGVGTIIMVVTGYASYMKHIQASTKLAFLASKPLKRINNQYLVLAGFYLIGMALKLVITSQAGLAVLMLATVFPVLIAIGVAPLTAASVLALLCLDYGPNDGSTLFMAGVAKMNVVELFLKYQVWVALCIFAVTALIIPFYYRYMDNRDKARHAYVSSDMEVLEDPSVPAYYALLPMIPLIIVFVDYFLPGKKKIDVITANFLGYALTFLIEFIRRSDKAAIPKDMIVILKAMGDIFTKVVAIIISASVFAEGIKTLGGITIFANYISKTNGAVFIIMALLTVVTYIFAVIMGSGAAPFFAFGPLTPDIAAKIGVPTMTLLLPMELATAIGRANSPVCGALIAIAGVAGVEPMQLVKRTTLPLILALVVNIIASYFFTI